ncbi:MAG TPA: M13 family metallopeptidase [Draconibacterium sp.]|nr:M13 family metallopeptidase [Draconibacterium sp.]
MKLKKSQLALAALILIVASFVFTTGCKQKAEPSIMTDYMDLSVKPGDDFYHYANGNWIKSNTIPEDRSSYESFDIVRKKRDEDVRTLLEEVSKNTDAEKGSITQKIRDFYVTAMDTLKLEDQGISQLQPELDRINNMKTTQDFEDLVARFHTYGLDPLFSAGTMQDLMNSELYKFYFMQGGIGLPDRDYYTKEDDRSKEIREEYVKHVAKMLEMAGEESGIAQKDAATIMNIETRLAESSKTRVELRNIPALYNKMSMEQFAQLAPGFDWSRYLADISDKDFGDVIIGMPDFFKEVGVLMSEIPLDDWKVYLKWNLINRSAEFLNEDFVNQDFKFYSEFLSGNPKIKPRWERVVGFANGALGEPLGELYVAKYFPPEYKEKMVVLVGNLKKALRHRIENLEWMTDSTKQSALEKLDAMGVKIGYPDKWKDFSKLEIETDSYVMNVRRASYFAYYQEIDKFGKPVDKTEWGMTPQTVNAGYNPLANDITFPAAILQPPFFYANADEAVNYGAIGMAIGHEMTHGFDDQGRNFDKDGNMINWWTEEDAEQFNKRTQLLVDQYNGFVVLDSVHVNGQLSLGENIADFGGLTVSLEAYKMSLEGKPTPKPIDGFTDVQRFFLSYAQLWKGLIRDKALLREVQEDVHPWGQFRVNGAMFDVPELYEAFNIQPGDSLYRTVEQRPVIW